MNFLYGHTEAVAKFVADMIPHCRRGFGPNVKTIGIVDGDGRLMAGLVFHNWDPDAEIIEISGAAVSKRWLTRAVLTRMFEYPFAECGCQLVVMRILASDTRLQRMLRAYGFELISVPRLFGRDADGFLATLTDEAWAGNKFNARRERALTAEAA